MKLVYFDLFGRGEVIRQVLAYAKADYEDKRISFEEFGKIKADEPDYLEFNQVPVLVLDDGKKLVQGNSILRYLGAKYGLEPSDAHDKYLVDSFLDAYDDLFAKFLKVHMTQDAEEKKKLGEEIGTVHLPFYFKKFEARLAANNKEGHFVGDKYTIADFRFGTFLTSVLYNDAMEACKPLRAIAEAHPHINKFYQSYKALLADYLAKRENKAI